MDRKVWSFVASQAAEYTYQKVQGCVATRRLADAEGEKPRLVAADMEQASESWESDPDSLKPAEYRNQGSQEDCEAHLAHLLLYGGVFSSFSDFGTRSVVVL